MTLREYLKEKKIRLDDFIPLTGYSYSYMSKIYAGRPGGIGIGYILEKLTGGAVTVDEIVNPKSGGKTVAHRAI